MLAPCVAQKFVNTPQDLFGYGRSPGWGEFLKESLASAFERTTTGAVLDEADVLAAEKEAYGANAPGYKEQALTDPFGGFAFGPMAAPDSGTAPAFIPREEWNENNPLFREGIEWREGMTEVRARVYAEDYDLREFRNRLIARGEEEYGFLGGTVPGFFAGMLGSLPDPVNLIPFGRALGAGKGFLAGAKRGAFEGALSNAAVDALVFPDLQRRGADLGVADFALDAAFGAALGGILGGAGGYLGARRAARAEERAKALDALAASEEAADRVKREQGKVTGYYLDPFEWARQETREALLTARRSIHGRDRQPILKAFELAADAVTDGRAVDVGPVPGLREAIGRAYDAVLDDPLGGPADEVLAVLRSPEFERVLLERGPAFFAEDGHLIFSGEYIQRVSGFPRSGGGMVKIIWKHGEISGGESRFQVTREDIMRLPDILNEYEPIRNKRGRLEWTVAGDEGIPLVAVVGKQKGREPVTVISVLRSENPNRQLSKKREAPASPDVSKSSMEDRMTGIRDTTPGDYSNLHRGGEGLSSESIADNASEVNVVSSAPDFRIETSEEFTPAPPLSEKARSAFEDMGADEKTGTTPEEMQAVEQAALGQAPPEEAAALRAAQEAEISRLRMEEEGFNIMGCIMEVLE